MHTAVRRALHAIVLLLALLLARPGAAQVTATETLVFPVLADTVVDAALPTSNFDGDTRLRADASPMRVIYLRVAVSGLGGRPVLGAALRLGVTGQSTRGGSLHRISDDSWNASTMTWDTRPAVDGPALVTMGAVALGSTVDFDLTGTVGAEGVYDFAIDSTSTDGVTYASSAATGGQRPQLVVTVPAGPDPVVRVLQPADGAVFFAGDVVTLQASVTDDQDTGLASELVWTSSQQGALGVGAIVATPLTEGTHTLTAGVRDSSGRDGAAQVTVNVRPRSASNTPPLVAVTGPADQAIVGAGQVLSFAGSATDVEDGMLSAGLQWTSTIDGVIGRGAGFARTLSAGTHRITARVTDSGGLADSTSITVTVTPPTTLSVPVSADTYVQSSKSNTKFGTNKKLLVGSSPERVAYLRFVVARVSPFAVRRAVLRLTVNSGKSDGSSAGGTVRALGNGTWPETATSYKNRPAVDGAVLATAGAVVPDQVVDFDVTPAVRGDGTVSVALVSGASDGVVYRSRESLVGKPQLLLTLGPPNIVLSGTMTTRYLNDTLYADARVDARAATFIASVDNTYPVNLGGGPGVLFAGGMVAGLFDRGWSWQQMHDTNNAGIAFENPGLVVDGVRLDNLTDGIRPQGGDNFVIRNVHMSWMRDDCVENDHLEGGLLDDSLLDGCYNAFSARPSQPIIDSGYSGAGKLWTIQNTLVRLQPMPGPNSTTADGFGHGGFFKWHKWGDPAGSLSPKLALYNNVFLVERVGDVGPDRMGVPPGELAGCANNVVVWLGAGPFPSALPSCFTVTTNRTVWDDAVATWTARHPGVHP